MARQRARGSARKLMGPLEYEVLQVVCGSSPVSVSEVQGDSTPTVQTSWPTPR